MVMHVGNQFRRLRQEDLEVNENLSYVAKLSQNTYHKNILKDLSGPTCNIQSPLLRQEQGLLHSPSVLRLTELLRIALCSLS